MRDSGASIYGFALDMLSERCCPRTFKIYFNKKVVHSFTIYVINTASTSSYPDALCQFYSVYTLVISSLCLFLWLLS